MSRANGDQPPVCLRHDLHRAGRFKRIFARVLTETEHQQVGKVDDLEAVLDRNGLADTLPPGLLASVALNTNYTLK